jgi:CrcB protein
MVGSGFPVATLIINVLGSFLMGIAFVYVMQREAVHIQPFVMSGVLGGFTTFSAFSLDAFALYERGEVGEAALYVALSVVLSVAGLVLGVWLARSVWA